MPVICTGGVPKERERQIEKGGGGGNHNHNYVIRMDIFSAIGWTLWSHIQNNHG